MPKIKTNRSAAKRFKKTASGKFKRSHALARHNMSSKSKKRKRHLRQSAMVNASFHSHLARILPYL